MCRRFTPRNVQRRQFRRSDLCDLTVVEKLIIARINRIEIMVRSRRRRFDAVRVMTVVNVLVVGIVKMHVRTSGMSVRLSDRRSRM